MEQDTASLTLRVVPQRHLEIVEQRKSHLRILLFLLHHHLLFFVSSEWASLLKYMLAIVSGL